MSSSGCDTPRQRHKTPKQRVLKQWPKANAYQWADQWTIYSGDMEMGNSAIGCGRTATKAWDDAARNL